MLAQSEVVPYLLQRKLIDPRSVVEGDLVVFDRSRRNRNFQIMVEPGPSYLLKQGVGPDRIATVAHEAAVYQFLHSSAKNDGFERYLPRSYGYDPQENILILELSPDSENLRYYHARRGHFSKTLAAAAGNALGILHRKTSLAGTGASERRSGFISRPPWILSIHRTEVYIFREFTSANIELIKIIQQFKEFCNLLDELRQDWKSETLIHGDIKWDNCITFSPSPSGRKTGLKIVDWELASWGDPCWDIGSIFSEYLSFWLLSIPVTGEAPPEHFAKLARYPLEKMQPALRTFWNSYTSQMKLDAAISGQWLLRAVRYGAARLVQTAIEQTQSSVQLTGNTICFLQLSLNILQRPHEAVVQLLGIPLLNS